MTKQEKIEKLLKQAKAKFASLSLPQEEIKARLLAQFDQAETFIKPARYNISQEIFKLKLYKFGTLSLSVILIILLSSVGIGYAADKSIPGDWLYPLDRKVEEIELVLLRKPQKLNQKRIQHLEERASEWQKLKAKKRNGKIIKNQDRLFHELQSSYIQNLKILKMQQIPFDWKEQNQLENDIKSLEKINNLIKEELMSIKGKRNLK